MGTVSSQFEGYYPRAVDGLEFLCTDIYYSLLNIRQKGTVSLQSGVYYRCVIDGLEFLCTEACNDYLLRFLEFVRGLASSIQVDAIRARLLEAIYLPFTGSFGGMFFHVEELCRRGKRITGVERRGGAMRAESVAGRGASELHREYLSESR